MSANELLQYIQRRPAMYLGNTPHLFTSLAAFLGGYVVGYSAAQKKVGDGPPADLVPPDFNKFVTERFGEKFPAGGKGWETFIQENSASETEAFALFFKLRNEYDAVQSQSTK